CKATSRGTLIELLAPTAARDHDALRLGDVFHAVNIDDAMRYPRRGRAPWRHHLRRFRRQPRHFLAGGPQMEPENPLGQRDVAPLHDLPADDGLALAVQAVEKANTVFVATHTVSLDRSAVRD